jgi:hypothetical protein
MTDFDPFDDSLRDAFTRGDVDEDTAFANVVHRGQRKQRQRTIAVAGVSGALVLVVFVALLATTNPRKSTLRVEAPFFGNGIAATTSTTTPVTPTTTGASIRKGGGGPPPRVGVGGSTSTTVSPDCASLGLSPNDQPSVLDATITFAAPVPQGDLGVYTMTIKNSTNAPAATWLDLGTVFVTQNNGADQLLFQQTAASDTPKDVVSCLGQQYLVVPANTTLTETGVIPTDQLAPGTYQLNLWLEHQLTKTQEFGGPGGTLTITPGGTTTTSTSVPETTTTT